MRKVIITLDEKHDIEETLREVTRLVEEGFTSGYEPQFEIVEE